MEDPLYLQKNNSATRLPQHSLPQNQHNLMLNNNYILKYYFDTMNACNPQERLTKAQIALNIKHYEYSQQFGANYLNRFENNMRECHNYQFQRQNEMNKKIKHRCLNNVGPPPRPFKKARYAWEIKNYDYTVRRMSRPLEEDAVDQGTSQDSRSSTNVSPEAVTSQNSLGPADAMCNFNTTLSNEPDCLPVNEPHPEYLGPVMPLGYPPHYNNFVGTEQGITAVGQAPQQMQPPDPDASLIRWHTRQLCRSIFDNTVNRMLENMGFSPVTEGSQGLHPLLVLNLSDDEEREAEEAHQRALETHALSAALQQKGLIPTPYHYESATTSDYDSSEEEESELGDTAGSEDLACDTSQNVPTEGRPFIPYGPANMPIAMVSLSGDHESPPSPKLDKTFEVSCPSAPQDACDLKANCDDLCRSPSQSPMKMVLNCDASECAKEAPTAQLKLDDNENCISKSQTLIEGKLERVLDDDTSKTSDSENNNNDKFFIRNAIEMAIKQHGLGFQRA